MRNISISLFYFFVFLSSSYCFAEEAIADISEAVGAESSDQAVAEDSGSRVLVALDLVSADLDKKLLAKINDYVSVVLRKESGSSLVTQKDLLKWMQFGKESEKLECASNKQCIMDISKTVKNDLLFSGTIGKVGDIYTINVYLVDAKKAETIARESEEANSLEEIKEAAGRAASRLVSSEKDLSSAQVISLEELGENPRIAVMDFQAAGVDKSLAQNITDVVTVELKQFKGFSIISRQEIQTMLSFEATKQGVGCDDDSCFAEIGAALGVGFLVVGNIGLVADTYIIGIKVINIMEARIIGREQEHFKGPADGLLPAARFTLRRVFGAPYDGEGFLKLSVNEEESEVELDGKSLGLYPDLTLPESMQAGKYHLAVKKDDFFPYERDIYVEPARQTPVQVTLLEEPAEWWETWWFWTVVGAVVVGGVTTGAVLGTMQGDTPETGGGSVTINEK